MESQKSGEKGQDEVIFWMRFREMGKTKPFLCVHQDYFEVFVRWAKRFSEIHKTPAKIADLSNLPLTRLLNQKAEPNLRLQEGETIMRDEQFKELLTAVEALLKPKNRFAGLAKDWQGVISAVALISCGWVGYGHLREAISVEVSPVKQDVSVIKSEIHQIKDAIHGNLGQPGVLTQLELLRHEHPKKQDN